MSEEGVESQKKPACLKCGGKVAFAGLTERDLCHGCTPWTGLMIDGLVALVICLITFVLAVALSGQSADMFDREYVGTGLHPGAPVYWASVLCAGISILFCAGAFGCLKGRIGGVLNTVFGLAMLIGAYTLHGRSIVVAGDEYGGRFMAYLLLVGMLVLAGGLGDVFPEHNKGIAEATESSLSEKRGQTSTPQTRIPPRGS